MFFRDAGPAILKATLSAIDQLCDGITQQKRDVDASLETLSDLNQSAHEQTLKSVNLRFDNVIQVVRELQKRVNQLTPEEIKNRIDEIVSIDPLVPRADKFEKRLEDLDKTLRSHEVIAFA